MLCGGGGGSYLFKEDEFLELEVNGALDQEMVDDALDMLLMAPAYTTKGTWPWRQQGCVKKCSMASQTVIAFLGSGH